MPSQVTGIVERSSTCLALVRFLTGVSEHVTTKIPRNGKTFRTLLAFVWPFT